MKWDAVIDLLVMILFPATGVLYFSAFMEKRPGWTKWKFGVIMLSAIMLHTAIGYILNDLYEVQQLLFTVLTITKTFTFLFLLTIPYQGTLIKKLFLDFSLLIILLIIELITALMLTAQDASAYDGMYDDGTAIQLIIFILCFVVASIFKAARRKREAVVASPFIYVLVSSIPVFSLFFLFFYFFEVAAYAYGDGTLVLVSGFVGVVNLFSYWLYSSLESMYAQNRTLTLQEQRYELRDEYYQQVETHHQEVRMLKHDLKNHLIPLAAHIQSGDHQKAVDRLEGLIDQLQSASQWEFSVNTCVNALLNRKYLLAQEHGIVCDFEISVPAELDLDENDLSSVLGNILDNAIEACIHCSGQRYIQLRMALQQNIALNLNCENSTDGTSQDTRSRKENPSEHGLGLKSIRRIVDKHDGEMQHRFTSHSFLIGITLPIRRN